MVPVPWSVEKGSSMAKTLIPYLDRNSSPKGAIAGSDALGNTVTGHTAFDVDGNTVNVATKENQQALNNAIGEVDDAASTSGSGTVISLLKGLQSLFSNMSLKASTALIGRVALADGNGTTYSPTNQLAVTDSGAGPSNDAFPIVNGFDYAPTYPKGLILRARVEGTIDVTTLSGNRRVLHWAACETRPLRVTKVWDTSNTTAGGIEGMV